MRRVLSVLAGTAVAASAVLATASPAAAAAARHIGIVVRYANGRVSAGCTTVGGSGLQVLERKHSVVLGTQQYSGFVLKVDNVGTSRPDNTHYWSYWHSSGHGGWTYSSSGAASYTPRAGTVEGWSYVNGQSSAQRPRSYTYAALCGQLDPKPEPAPKATTKPTPTTTAHSAASSTPPRHRAVPNPGSSAPTAAATRSDANTAPPLRSRHAARPTRSTPPAQHRPAKRTHARAHAAQASPTPASSSAAGNAGPAVSATPVARTAAATAEGSSPSAWPTIGALLVVAALGAGAWLVARRRAG